jgi:hypothetical protein
MSSDPNKKSPRSFQCRDVLWETFELMARELECSVDYLVNEAMKQYARQRGQGGRLPYANARDASARDTAVRESIGTAGKGTGGFAGVSPPPRTSRNTTGALPPPPPRGGGLPAPPPPPRNPPGIGRQTLARGGGPSGPGGPLGSHARTQPQPQQPLPPPPPASSGHVSVAPPAVDAYNGANAPNYGGANYGANTAQLSILYQGNRVGVNKDRFVIGRGKQSSDLMLKDPNVSRQHAMVEYQNGIYFMVDMGSTNGVEYNGQRIARKQIIEGDAFRICDHELRFTFR